MLAGSGEVSASCSPSLLESHASRSSQPWRRAWFRGSVGQRSISWPTMRLVPQLGIHWARRMHEPRLRGGGLPPRQRRSKSSPARAARPHAGRHRATAPAKHAGAWQVQSRPGPVRHRAQDGSAQRAHAAAGPHQRVLVAQHRLPMDRERRAHAVCAPPPPARLSIARG